MPQEPLEILAEETGGRSFLNASALDDGVGEALTESSAYYLLAWRPDGENQRSGKSRIKVVVKDRPDLRVRMRQELSLPAGLYQVRVAVRDRQKGRTDSAMTWIEIPPR